MPSVCFALMSFAFLFTSRHVRGLSLVSTAVVRIVSSSGSAVADNTQPAFAAQGDGWPARLDLSFARRGARTVVERVAHHGPLRIQRALYSPEDDACHVYLLHPPGGLVGGDEL